MSSSIRIITNPAQVVNTPTFKINELTGNVATNDDRLSIAHVHALKGASEPFLTLHYEEWIYVVKGHIHLQTDTQTLSVCTGSTAYIPRGTRFRPSFVEDTEYVPVCMPAFRPDRCVREDDEDAEGVAKNLKKLHADAKMKEEEGDKKKTCDDSNSDVSDVIYHMMTRTEWEKAVQSQQAYFPPTFVEDGYYTHATAVPSRLVETANQFYQDVSGDWVCLQFRRSVLRSQHGIIVKDEEAMPVGAKQVNEQWEQGNKNWICPHVYGGIPITCVERIYPMKRDGPTFTGIEGLV